MYVMGNGEAWSVTMAQSSGPGTQASDAHRVTLTHCPAPILQEVLSQGIQLRS